MAQKSELLPYGTAVPFTNGGVDVLSQLLEASWRGIPVPTLLVSSKNSHGIVPHKRQDRDGQRVENTGLNSPTFAFKIPFINTIARGQNETWRGLFPDTHRRFIVALEDRTTGALSHPLYGDRRCKVTEWEETLDPEFRGGPTIMASWMETVDEETAVSLASESTFGIARSAAISLDAAVSTLPPAQQPNLDEDGFASFLDYVQKLSSVGNTIDRERSIAVAKIDRVIGKIQRLEESASRTSQGFLDTTGRLVSALLQAKKTIATAAKPTKFYLPPKATTVPQLAVRLKNSPAEILALNPILAGSVLVSSETPVRYYLR